MTEIILVLFPVQRNFYLDDDKVRESFKQGKLTIKMVS